MKYLRKIMAAAAASAMAFAFFGCSDEENDSENQISVVELPASVGENPFAGKTFTNGGSEESKESDIEEYGFWDLTTWVFSDSTVLETETMWSDGKETTWKTVYRYSYDTEKALIYFAQKSNTIENGTYSTLDEYAELLKKDGVSGTDLEAKVLNESCWISTMRTWKYKIEKGNILSLQNYFTGKLPSNVWFYNNDNAFSIDLWNGIFTISGDGWSSECYTTFEDGKFTGRIYRWTYSSGEDSETEENNVCKYLGTVSGTYECSGTGPEGTVTLTATELPEAITGLEINKPVVFKQNSWDE